MGLLVTLLITIVLARRCVGYCEYSESELSLREEYGILKPKNYPIRIQEGQTCQWKLPFENHVGKPLFIYIDTVDIKASAADIQIGDEPFFDVIPRANCRLYGVNITEIDLNLLKNLIERYHLENRYCKGWSVNEKEIRTVTFRSFRNRPSSSYYSKFKIIYDYKAMHKSGLTTSTVESSTTRTSSSSKTSTTPSALSSGFDVVDPNTQAKQSGQNTTLIITNVVLAVLLLVVAAVLVVLVYKYRKAIKTSDTHSTSISPATRHQENVSSPTNQSPNELLYEIPMQTSQRTPAANTGFSNMSEPYYHNVN